MYKISTTHCNGVSGDKLSGSAVDWSGNSTTPHRKKKLTRSQRSYEKQKPENKHLHLKPFHSDPTNSVDCGHLALAKELSHEYKYKSRHAPESSAAGKGHDSVDYSEDLPNRQGNNNGCESENLHQRLRRQLAIQGNNDPRASNSSKTHIVAEPDPEPDRDCASDEHSVTLPRSSTEVSPCSSRHSFTDTANGTPLDTDRCPSSASRAHHSELELLQRTHYCNNPQQSFVADRSSHDRASGGRRAPPFLPPTGTYVDNMYLVRPIVSSYDYLPGLHSYRQFRAPQLAPRIHMSPSWPQGFVHQPRPYLAQDEQMRHAAITQHHFLRR